MAESWIRSRTLLRFRAALEGRLGRKAVNRPVSDHSARTLPHLATRLKGTAYIGTEAAGVILRQAIELPVAYEALTYQVVHLITKSVRPEQRRSGPAYNRRRSDGPHEGSPLLHGQGK